MKNFLKLQLVELEDTTRLSASTLEMMKAEAQKLLQKDEVAEGAGKGSEEEAESRQEIQADSDQIQEG